MMIKEAIDTIWQSLKDAWDDLFGLALVNAAWLFSSLTVILFPISTAGMYYITNRVSHGKAIHFSDFWDGVKKYWWRSWLWFLGTTLGTLLAWISLSFYTNLVGEGLLMIAIGGFWLSLMVVWLGMQIYFWPLMVEQSQPNILQAWRNAFVLTIQQPLYTLLIALFIVALVLLSLLFPISLVLVCMSVIGILGNNATVRLLVKAGIMEEPRPYLH